MSEELRLRGRDWVVSVQMIFWGLGHERTGLSAENGLVQTSTVRESGSVEDQS